MKVTSTKLKADEIIHAATETKIASKMFSSTTKADESTVGSSILPRKLINRMDCIEAHPL